VAIAVGLKVAKAARRKMWSSILPVAHRAWGRGIY